MSTIVLTIFVASLGLGLIWWVKKHGEKMEMQIIKRVMLEELARFDRAIPIRTWDVVSTDALDELMDKGLVATTDGDSLFRLTNKGRQHLKTLR